MNKNVPFSEYLQHPGYGSGAVRQALRSLSHLQHYVATRGEPPTPQMLLGSATHCAVLEPREFNERYVTPPEGLDRRTKAGKEAWAMFQEANQDKQILTSDQRMAAWTIRDTLAAMPEYRALVYTNGTASVEVSQFWMDRETSVELKARADMLLDDGVIVDLKTAADASPRGFAAACARFGYHVQAAMYLDAFGEDKYTRFAFVACETKPPFACGVYWLDEASIELGRQQYRHALEMLRVYREAISWPIGYGEQEISLPNYAFHDAEDNVEVQL